MKLIYYTKNSLESLDFEKLSDVKSFIYKQEKKIVDKSSWKKIYDKLKNFTSQFISKNGIYSIWDGSPLAVACDLKGCHILRLTQINLEVFNVITKFSDDFLSLKHDNITVIIANDQLNKDLFAIYGSKEKSD